MELNNANNKLQLKTDSKIYQNDDIIIVTTKSFQLNDAILNALLQSGTELIFLQNGLLIKSNLQSRSSKIAIGTVTGIQATMKDGMLTASLHNSKIAIELKDDCKKIKELIQKTKMQNSSFVGSLDSQIMVYEKFIRWIIVSSLNIFYDSSLGSCLQKVKSMDLTSAISELAVFLDKKFNINIDQSKILQDLYQLPYELKTSSFFDYKQDIQSELDLELEFIINYLTESNFECITLKKWRKVI